MENLSVKRLMVQMRDNEVKEREREGEIEGPGPITSLNSYHIDVRISAKHL